MRRRISPISVTVILKGDLEISTPRDRDGAFEPTLVRKHQTRISGLDDKIIFFYAKGQTTTEIVETIKELYDVDISSTLVSRVTDNILDDITAWQNRPLSSIYPIVYLDCIVVKIRQDKQIINKAIYLALGVNLNGKKELLGMWLSENEGAKFWLGVLTELQNRGVQDILIACVDGLKGFPDAINTVSILKHRFSCVSYIWCAIRLSLYRGRIKEK